MSKSNPVNIPVYFEPPKDKYCPYWRKPMNRACPTCVKWVKLTDNDGTRLEGYNCADVWAVQFALWNGKFANQTGASVDKLTNVIVKRAQNVQSMHHTQAIPAQQAQKQQLLDHASNKDNNDGE